MSQSSDDEPPTKIPRVHHDDIVDDTGEFSSWSAYPFSCYLKACANEVRSLPLKYGPRALAVLLDLLQSTPEGRHGCATTVAAVLIKEEDVDWSDTIVQLVRLCCGNIDNVIGAIVDHAETHASGTDGLRELATYLTRHDQPSPVDVDAALVRYMEGNADDAFVSDEVLATRLQYVTSDTLFGDIVARIHKVDPDDTAKWAAIGHRAAAGVVCYKLEDNTATLRRYIETTRRVVAAEWHRCIETGVRKAINELKAEKADSARYTSSLAKEYEAFVADIVPVLAMLRDDDDDASE